MPEDDPISEPGHQVHNWQHRGINPPSSIGNGGTRFFSGIVIRYVLSFLLGSLSASFFLGGKSRDISDLLIWKGSIDTEISRMNREGTNASRMKVEEERGQIQSNTNSINDLYRKLEPIGAMQAKIERLQHDVDTKK